MDAEVNTADNEPCHAKTVCFIVLASSTLQCRMRQVLFPRFLPPGHFYFTFSWLLLFSGYREGQPAVLFCLAFLVRPFWNLLPLYFVFML